MGKALSTSQNTDLGGLNRRQRDAFPWGESQYRTRLNDGLSKHSRFDRLAAFVTSRTAFSLTLRNLDAPTLRERLRAKFKANRGVQRQNTA